MSKHSTLNVWLSADSHAGSQNHQVWHALGDPAGRLPGYPGNVVPRRPKNEERAAATTVPSSAYIIYTPCPAQRAY